MPGVGDRLGRYTLLKRLAIGGMGEVFVAAKSGPVGFGPFVALKVLRDELAVDQQFVDMLVDEANITKHLNHQNLVSVLDLGEDEGSYYIAMEFVQGITAERLIESLVERERRLDVPLALHIGVELCKALKYAHSGTNDAGEPLGIVHRDVTPANILISTEGEVKLTDFGIARAKGRIHQTQAGVLKGKFGYMAPEMVRYEALDARVDIFCAGVALYLLAAGRHPVAHASVMEAIQRYETKRIPLPSEANPDITPDLDQVLMKALEPQPVERWQSAAELGEALQAILLSHPEWRHPARDAASLLARRIREVAPEVFGEVVPPETLDRLASEREESLLSNPSLSGGADASGRIGSLLASDGSRVRGETDVETDEGLPYDDVQKARAHLAALGRPEPMVFGESSTDPNRASSKRDDRLEEPMLPGPGPGELGLKTGGAPLEAAPRLDESPVEPTVAAGFDWSEPSIERTLASGEDDGDGATVVGVALDAVDGRPSVLDEDTIGTGPDDPDPPTVIPLDGPEPVVATVGFAAGLEPDRKPPVDYVEPGAATVLGAETDVWGAESDPGATLLEGLDVDAVRQAIQRLPSATPTDRTLADDLEEDDPNQATYVRMVMDPAESAENSKPEGGLPPLAGPIRIVMGADGAPTLAPGTSGEGAPLPQVQGLSSGQVGSEGLDVGTATGRWMAGEIDAGSLEWSDEAAGRRAVATRNQPFVEDGNRENDPGGGHGQADGVSRPLGHQPGPLPSDGSFGPSANGARLPIARRPEERVPGPPMDLRGRQRGRADFPTARNPEEGYRRPPDNFEPHLAQDVRGSSRDQPKPSFVERQGPLLVVLGLTAAVAGAFGYAWSYTELLWPRLQIDTVPPQAQVTIDGVTQPGRTPLVVQVAPGQRHRIELRVEGYAPALREITDGIGRGRTYALEVALDRVPPTLFIGPVPGRVVLNGEPVGTGREVRLSSVPTDGQVRIRVEADGHEPYEVIFESADAIPSSLDIPLEPFPKG